MKKRIPINIVFAFLFLACLLINFGSKLYTYIVSEKYVGKIIGFSTKPPIYPKIEFVNKDNRVQVLENEEWFYAFADDQIKSYESDLDNEVMLLYNESSSSYEYVTFYNYWLSVATILISFCTLFFGVIFFELIQNAIFKG